MAVIRRLVKETREQGFSVIPGLIVRDYWALGVPLVNAQGRPEAGLSLVAAAPRLRVARRAALAERLMRVSREVMEAAAGHGAPVA